MVCGGTQKKGWPGKELAWGKRWLTVREELVGRTEESLRADKGTVVGIEPGWKWMVLEEGGDKVLRWPSTRWVGCAGTSAGEDERRPQQATVRHRGPSAQ